MQLPFATLSSAVTSMLDTIYGANMLTSAQGSQKCKPVAICKRFALLFYEQKVAIEFIGCGWGMVNGTNIEFQLSEC